MEVRIQTLTPLWTGGVDGSMDRIHETGIIGSMRWWYEAIVRGLGGYACDPTSDEKCSYNPKDPSPPEDQLCTACYMFGCTGWKRRFRLEIIDKSKMISPSRPMLIPSCHQPKKGKSGNWVAGGWYIIPGRITQEDSTGVYAHLKFSSPSPSSNQQIISTLVLIDRWGGLGAKNHLGYGVVRFCEDKKDECKQLQAASLPSISSEIFNANLPALSDFFFAKIRFKPKAEDWWKEFQEIKAAFQGYVENVKPNDYVEKVRLKDPISKEVVEEWLALGAFPIAPIVRNWLHYKLFIGQSFNVLNFFFGTTREICPTCYTAIRDRNKVPRVCGNCSKSFHVEQTIKRAGSKIKVSSAYKIHNSECWEFRIWGWLPQHLPDNCSIKRDDLLKILFDAIKPPKGSLWSGPLNNLDPCNNAFEWREYGASKRDSRGYKNPAEFSNSLLEDVG